MLRLILALAALLFAVPALATVTVTTATGGTAISSATLYNNTWVTLTGPSLAEAGNTTAGTGVDEIQVGTYTLTAPSGFKFNTAAPVTVTVTGSRTGTDVTLASSTATVTQTTISITVTALSTGNRRSVLTWSGIQVAPTACSPQGNGNITMTTSSTTSFSSTNFGTLTQTSGLFFIQQPSSAQAGTAISPAVTVQPCGTNTLPTVNVALTTAGGATLSGTTSASSSSGLASFSNLSVNLGGTYTLTATATGFTSATSSSFTIHNLLPTTTSISPTSKNIGDNAFTLTVNGTNFNSSSVVYLNGSARTTTYVSPTQLSASIPSSDMTTAAYNSVTVVNPAPGGGASNAQTFAVNNPVPTLTSLSSTTKAVGSATFTMTLTGTNFNTSTVAYMDGVARTTTYSRSTRVTFDINATEMSSAGVHYITVVNPAPGGGTSAALPFVVTSTCTSRQTGPWSSSNTWTGCANGIPGAGWQVAIANGHTVTLDTDTASLLSLTINAGGTLTATAATGAKTLNLQSSPLASYVNLTNNGTLSLGAFGSIKLWAASVWSGTGTTWSMNNLDFNSQSLSLGTSAINVTVNGNFSNTGTFTSGSGTWTFAGSGAQTIGNAATFTRVAVNNTGSGVTLAGGNLTASTLLTLTGGVLITGSNAAIASTDCRTGIARTNGFVQGNLRLTFPTGTNISCTFHVGSGGYYAPIGITANSTTGTLTGSTYSGDHPAIASSGISSTKSANRYWRLWATGDNATFSSYGVTLNFNSADLDSGASWYDFIVGIYAGSTWSKPSSITTYATATSASNITGSISSQTDFAVGEDSNACSVPSGYNTCVCDNFSRSVLNPSTIFGSDWVVGNSSGTFGNPVINSGTLRLTDNSNNVSTVAVVPGTFPAAGNKISVEFKHYAYASTTNPGADGIALTLSDASKSPAAGAYGGSLGYAQKTGINGFNGGWLGVGLDEWGNYTNPTEGRVGGPGFIAQTVTLRGSGSGSSASADNYPFLVTTGALSSTIDNRASSSRAPGYMYRITVDATAYTWNSTTNSGTKTTQVRVERDTTGSGDSYVILPNLNLTDIYTYNTNQAAVPTNWKLSFTGGTGANTNIHEIDGLKICSTYYTVPGSFDIQFSSSSGLTCATPGGTPSSPTVTISALTNTGALDTAYTGTVTLRAKLPSGSNSTTAVWRKVGTTTNITNGSTYTFVSGDGGRASFYLTDTAAETLTVTVSDSTASSTSSSSIAYTSSGSYYTIATADQSSSEVVAGRPHLMKVTAYSGCSASPSAVSGSKAMSGWYTPDSVYHPTGAAAPTMCPAPTGGTPTNCSGTGACTNAQLTTSAPGVSNLTLDFNGASSAYFCLSTTDVGKYTLGMQETANTAAKSTSSPLLTVRPFALYFNTAKKSAVANPKGGSKFVAAEDPFEGRVSAVQWSTTLANSNWAQVTPSATVLPENNSAAWASALVTASFAADTTLSLASFSAPSGCVSGSCNGALGGTTSVSAGSYSGGSAVLASNSLSFSDVGSIRIGASVSNYLASGMSISSVSDIVGYFYPASFSLAGSITPTCAAGGFSYMDQAGLGIAFSLTAKGAAGGTTRNYSSALGYSPLAPVSLVAEDDTYGGGDRLARISPISLPGTNSWGNGVYSYSVSSLTFSRLSSLDGAFDALDIGVQATDSDGVTIGSLDMNPTATGCGSACSAKKIATTKVRYGRARLLNANGSELLDLPMPLRTEYWTGSRWANNTLDTCTGSGGTNGTVTLSAAGDGAAAAWVTAASPFLPCVRDTGTGGSSGMACATAAPSSPVDKHFKTGSNLWTGSDPQNAFNLWLEAPGAGQTGIVNVTANVPNWLKFNWAGAGDVNPSGRAVFGTIKSGKVIYRREMY